MSNALRDNDAIFGQQSAYLVTLGRASLDKALPRQMQREQGLLLRGFVRYKAHAGSAHGFADSFGITQIVSVRGNNATLLLHFDTAFGRGGHPIIPTKAAIQYFQQAIQWLVK